MSSQRASRGCRFLCQVVAAGLLMVPTVASADVLLFSGGHKDASGNPAWADRFGTFGGDRTVMQPTSWECFGAKTDPATGACPSTTPGPVHAEVQHYDAIGTNFIYSASIRVEPGADAHLQFRIADEGRFGVRLNTTGITFYDSHLEPRAPCSGSSPDTFTHCPMWTDPDQPTFNEIRSAAIDPPLRADSTHRVTVIAQGFSFIVWLDGRYQFTAIPFLPTSAFQVGRLGLYVFGDPLAVSATRFSDVVAVANPLEKENFSLLYSTAGYELTGTKRALVRTLTDVPGILDGLAGSTFRLLDSDGITRASGPLRRLPGKTFGMQLWEADFSSVSIEGPYTLGVDVNTSPAPFRGSRTLTTLRSAPFEIRSRLFTSKFLKPMSFINAEVRRGADEDFWRNWQIEAGRGAWSVGVDGAFMADRADTEAGATLVRVFNTDNQSLPSVANDKNVRLVGRVSIESGCDAQLRFQEDWGDWIAVTLQAGASGGCPFNHGPGAVRISREGDHAKGQFEELASGPISPAGPFVLGHAYDVEVLVQGRNINVFVDQPQGATRETYGSPAVSYHDLRAGRTGLFGLKAWGATARFEDVQAWLDTVHFEQLPPGRTRIPTFLNYDANTGETRDVPCQYGPKICPAEAPGKLSCRHPRNRADPSKDDPSEESNACNPIFSQLHGFHDSSSQVAEATSHGAFLTGLLQIWKSRAADLAPGEREMLRRALLTNELYLDKLFEEGGQTGQFAHQEMGRVAVDVNGIFNTRLGLYGESAFADDGATVDRALARQACLHAITASEWYFSEGDVGIDPVLASIVYTHLARCADREGLLGKSSGDIQLPQSVGFRASAEAAAEMVLDSFSAPGGLRDANREHYRVIPWFEGVYEILQTRPARRESYLARLNHIAGLLVTHITETHVCDESNRLIRRWCPPNGFSIVPQASGDVDVSRSNWVHMQSVPRTDAHGTLPFVGWYSTQGHIPTTATDAVLLARMTGNARLERIVAGHLYWPLGLNPGVPATKVVNGGGGGAVWQASSFVRGLDGPFARHHDGFRIERYSAKGWLDPWEDAYSSHREAWRIDPQNRFLEPPLRSFLSLVNGHVIWDRQWDYWNTREHGWLGGETFILGDGLFLKAGILSEDGLAPLPNRHVNPYDTTKLAFFDTTHVDRLGTGWGFDDPDGVPYAQASRAVHEFCAGKEFAGGRFTGHHLGERIGALCVPTSAQFFDLTQEQLDGTSWGFGDIDSAPWAQVARAATNHCNGLGHVGGFFTGHQVNGSRGVLCLPAGLARWYDSTESDLYDSGEGFGDINTVPWAKGARAATNICLGKGYSGGFFTGHQLNGLHGVVCLVQQ